MRPFKKPYHQALFLSLVSGKSAADAARDAGVSKPTAVKFREEYAEDIQNAQLRSMEGVLRELEDMLPDAAARMREWLRRPPPLPTLVCNCATNPHLKGCAVLGRVRDLHYRGHAADMKTIDRIFAAFDTLRDVDQEKRIKALEKTVAELTKPPVPENK